MRRRRVICLSLTIFGFAVLIFQMLTFNSWFVSFSKLSGQSGGLADAVSPRKAKSSILVLYWTSVFGKKVNVTGSERKYKWPFFSAGENCPVKCELTSNKSRVAEASALVIHGRDVEEMPTSGEFDSIPWIFHVNENPMYTRAWRDESIMARFNYLATYRLDSDFPCPQFLKPKLTKPVPFRQKTSLAIAIYSHCEDTRSLYLFRLMKHMQIDSYGKCLRNKPRIPKRGPSYDSLQIVMAIYKFTFVFPNSDCDYYITEKLYNALSSGSVPVWMARTK